MAKEAFYFSHDYNARNDDKILELRSKFGIEGYGIFWMVIESMAENIDGGLKASLLGGLSIGFGIAKEKLTEIMQFSVSINLFYEDAGKYFSKRLLDHKEFRKYLSDKGKEGVRIREEKKHGIKGGLSYPSSKERKGKERKEINGDEFVKFTIRGLEDFSIRVFTDCENWQLAELKSFITGSQQNFESIAMTNPTMGKADNFNIVLQEFINMIQGNGEYQAANQLRKYFGNWLAKKNGSLEVFISDCKSRSTTAISGKKNKNDFV